MFDLSLKPFLKTLTLIFTFHIFLSCSVQNKKTTILFPENLKTKLTEKYFQINKELKVSFYGYNPRKWQPAKLDVFQVPIDWLMKKDNLKNKIKVVKAVGEDYLFCSIKTDGYHYQKTKPHYTLFYIRSFEMDSGWEWDEFFADLLPQIKNNYQKIEIGSWQNKYLVMRTYLKETAYWSSPAVFLAKGDIVYEVLILYQGKDRKYVEKLFNYFPWRSLANY